MLLQDELLTGVLLRCPVVAVVASEEQDVATATGSPSGRYAVVFDPLDGSRNIDAAIPTGGQLQVHDCHLGCKYTVG